MMLPFICVLLTILVARDFVARRTGRHGLVIWMTARRMFETHGGALEVERRPTGGFGCRLELPVTAAAGAAGSVAT